MSEVPKETEEMAALRAAMEDIRTVAENSKKDGATGPGLELPATWSNHRQPSFQFDQLDTRCSYRFMPLVLARLWQRRFGHGLAVRIFQHVSNIMFSLQKVKLLAAPGLVRMWNAWLKTWRIKNMFATLDPKISKDSRIEMIDDSWCRLIRSDQDWTVDEDGRYWSI